MTFNGVGLSDNGFGTGNITGHTNEQPTFVYIEYDDTYLAEEYPDSLGIVTYTDGEITIDCSTYSIKSVDLYDKILTEQEIADRYNQSTFQFLNDTPTPTQQNYIDFWDNRKIGRQ